MQVLRTPDDLRRAGLGPASPRAGVLIPTMGALHEGHAALIRLGAAAARERRDPLGAVVTIFVNPTQFNERSDYDRYPRTEEHDLALCRDAGASTVFVPGLETVYPAGNTPATPPLPAVGTDPGLEDAHRPGHFAGVCQVVLRLFNLLNPAAAVFGEKDWQQLQVIRAMALREAPQIEILPAPTVRDADGLAMSSRNRFLGPSERAAALGIPHALGEACRASTPPEAETAMRRVLSAAGVTPEYAVVRDGETLGPVRDGRPARSLIAARIGTVRLIDNAPWTALRRITG
ncbi:MAG: pantoate--beta-alanine ligase [Phycisphaerales bacterium]